jgi:hypothetical protein
MGYKVFMVLIFEVVIVGVVTPRRLGGGYESSEEYIAIWYYECCNPEDHSLHND